MEVIHKVDTGNLARLLADSVEQGRRLENLSWRLWQRETFVVDNEENASPTTPTLPANIPSDSRTPELSRSVESLVDEEVVDNTRVPEIARPRVRRQDSCASTQSKCERHISSDDFGKMAVSIAGDKGPLAAPCHDAPVAKESLPVPPALERSGSNTAEPQSPEKPITASESSQEPSSQSLLRPTVVRGFSPFQIPNTRTICGAAQSSNAIPESLDTGDDCDRDKSLRNNKPIVTITKKPVFQIGSSSEEDGSLQSAVASSRPISFLLKKKQVSFNKTIDDEAAVDSDTDDYIDESAIDDDDDSSDWEDAGGSGKSSMDDKFFQRVDSMPKLASRKSLITLMLAQNDCARTLGNHASQSTSAIPRSRMAHGPSLGASSNVSDEAPLMMKRMRGPGLKPVHEVPRSSAQSIMTGPKHIQPQAALSPRTTRRNMLATELTESLRRHLLWERQQKSSTANAVLKRQHTSHDVANLKQYPEKPYMKKSEDVNASNWNQYFSKNTGDGYHSKGW
ncbi:hypothetical protein FGLOB1_7709 [Fusarium globosum]|uniref:Nitrogen regulatory protein areA GATA-like domain-containing protein n=1 Tax=Fusarium globosum TaxID=78864 RepID=A0A8H5Y6M7_9HYPO|nr:hypothetical protein FGLOB1_7709 [Fusarium globosum]